MEPNSAHVQINYWKLRPWIKFIFFKFKFCKTNTVSNIIQFSPQNKCETKKEKQGGKGIFLFIFDIKLHKTYGIQK